MAAPCVVSTLALPDRYRKQESPRLQRAPFPREPCRPPPRAVQGVRVAFKGSELLKDDDAHHRCHSLPPRRAFSTPSASRASASRNAAASSGSPTIASLVRCALESGNRIDASSMTTPIVRSVPSSASCPTLAIG